MRHAPGSGGYCPATGRDSEGEQRAVARGFRRHPLLVRNRRNLGRKNVAVQDLTTALAWLDLSGLESVE